MGSTSAIAVEGPETRPGSGSVAAAVLTAVLSALALACSAATAYAVWDLSTFTYQLPPGPGTPDPYIQEYFHPPVLVGLIPVALAALLALAGLVIGVLGLMRRRGRWRTVLLPAAALVLAAAGPIIASSIETPVF